MQTKIVIDQAKSVNTNQTKSVNTNQTKSVTKSNKKCSHVSIDLDRI